MEELSPSVAYSSLPSFRALLVTLSFGCLVVLLLEAELSLLRRFSTGAIAFSF